MADRTNEQIEALEEQVAHLTRIVDDLSDVVTPPIRADRHA